ncbi:DUF5694 domain-containing protein [Arenicella sp. 4NH20-0111]|uniref:DUF5694 domain-containing protein n=1 Tax=Arenicella sp. 4NH20-0111 TaxID=3127648 RepID=UPI00310C0C9C
MRSAICILLCIFISACETKTYKTALELQGLDSSLRVTPTEVMVLGTSHLAGYKDNLNIKTLRPLLDNLAEYNPDIITIESVSGETCDLIKSFPAEYPNVADRYCYDLTDFQVESGLTVADARSEIRRILDDGTKELNSSERRRLASAFLSLGEIYSALIQWLKLSKAEQKFGDGLGEKSMKFLEKKKVSMNENNQIGVRLALTLGHERIYAVDDHSADIIFAIEDESFWERMSEIWKSGARNPVHKTMQKHDELILNNKVVQAYRLVNQHMSQVDFVDNDFRKAMNDDLHKEYGRKYVAWYQARNLRMVSNVIVAAASVPGGRVLSIVGASHKPYFESYLDVMHDVKVVDVMPFLKGPKIH